ncbi:MAG: 3-oxoacyl-ACP synthase III [Archangiaceae bacterium]|nr:3-oxoacyl-ACP synthase III [Archangiaceae bacterium]
MRWSKVNVEAIAYELPTEIVTSAEIDARLTPIHEALKIAPGQLQSLTGIKERRRWPVGTSMSSVAARAGRKALDQAGVSADDVGAVIYAGVCRDNLEPATACAVAAELGTGPETLVFDVANACLGVMNAMVEIANRIELGQLRAGLVVSAESSREIVDATIERMNREPTLERYRLGLATMTGGSGSAAVLLTASDFSAVEHRLVAGAALSAPKHHGICRWGPSTGLLGERTNIMETDASQVLEHGVELGRATWDKLLTNSGWRRDEIDRVICHQVGAANRRDILSTIGVPESKDFSTFDRLGNMGTVSVPITAALANEAGFLQAGQRISMLGIGSGLNCLMLGLHW